MIKNTASQKIGAGLVSATDGSDFTSTVTVYVTIDAGTQAIGTVGSGICTHEGKGYHTYAPSQAETNGDLLGFSFTGTGAITATVQVLTIAGDAFNRLGAPAGASVSADVAAVKVDTAAILVDTGTTLDAALAVVDSNVDAILVDTAEIGAAGAGLTNINLPNQTMDIVGNITGTLSGSVGSVVGAVGSIAAGGIDSASFASQAITNGALATNAISASKLAADASVEIAGAVWDEDATAHQTTGTFGQAIGDPVADTNTIYKAVVTDAAGATVGVDVVAVKVDTAAILVDTAEIGAAGAGLTAIDLPNQTMDITGNLSGSVGSVTGAVGSVTGLTAATVHSDLDDIQARLPAALVSGRIDASVGAMAANVMTAAAAATDLTTELQTGLATAAALDAVDNFLDTEIADILVDTSTTLDDMVDDLEGRLSAALATALQAHSLAIGRVVIDVGSTTTAVVFELVNGSAASAVNDFYNGRALIFTSGALTLQATSITDYVGATKTATVSALTAAPADDVTAVLV